MKIQNYKSQVNLLLNVLPEVAKENCFALHGGTAINLFVRNMPRLSVDIDLTYIPIEDRITSLQKIAEALDRIKYNIEERVQSAKVLHQKQISKLQISVRGIQVKLEVNQTNRGLIQKPRLLSLCDYAQKEFDVFCAIKTVSLGQLYGGKICAALDRQHPRDLFDIKQFLENEGYTDEIKQGFLLHLLSSKRPIVEMLYPNYINQEQVLENQFSGMSKESFSYDDFERTRKKLIKTIHDSLKKEDKAFILSFLNAEPDWRIYDFKRFPSVQWKLQNLMELKTNEPEKHNQIYKHLKDKLI